MGSRITITPRWRDELAAAETVRRVARWDAELEAYALTPIHDDGALMTHAVEDAAKARDWGYEIEGGPEPERDWKSDREVVDVPQPRIVVKRCDEVEAEWTSADATILIVTHDALDDAIFVPIALLRAMLADIDAQQQPDPRPDLDEGWRVVSGDTAFAMPFGTIRECSGCGCLVSGGPTACLRCIDAQQGGA